MLGTACKRDCDWCITIRKIYSKLTSLAELELDTKDVGICAGTGNQLDVCEDKSVRKEYALFAPSTSKPIFELLRKGKTSSMKVTCLLV